MNHTETLRTLSFISSGIVGVIIGYAFCYYLWPKIKGKMKKHTVVCKPHKIEEDTKDRRKNQ